MPILKNKDKEGNYFSWGKTGHRYHFKKGNAISEGMARARAARQGRAVKRSQTVRAGRIK